MAAPMTSSDVLPAGICCAVTSSLGWAAFHAFTMLVPQVTSSGLLDSQTLIGPCAVSAEPPEAVVPPELLHAAVVAIAKVMTAAAQTCFFIMSPFGGGSSRNRDDPSTVHRCQVDMAARLTLE